MLTYIQSGKDFAGEDSPTSELEVGVALPVSKGELK